MEYTIEYSEVYTGDYTVEADTEEAAVEEFNRQVSEGKIDFRDLCMADSSIVPVPADRYEKTADKKEEDPMEKSLDLRFIFEEGRMIALVEHPESGDAKRFEMPLNAENLGETLPDFCADMMMEVSSWVSLWADEYAANL